MCGAVLQGTVGEASRGTPDVEYPFVAEIQPEGLDGLFQLQPAHADVLVEDVDDLHIHVVVDLLGGLGGDASVDHDGALPDGSLGFLTGREKLLVHEIFV